MGVIETVVDFPTSENIQSHFLRFGIWTPKIHLKHRTSGGMTGRKTRVISWAKKILQILMNGSLFLDDRIPLSERVDQLLGPCGWETSNL